VNDGTTDSAAGSVPHDALDPTEWHSLIEQGRSAGVLHADDVVEVLRSVELTSELLDTVRVTLKGHGIEIDEHVELLTDHTPPAGVPAPAASIAETAPVRRGRLRPKKSSPSDLGDAAPSSDTVRQYLREIGRVDLLTVEDERRLAQTIEDGRVAALRIDAETDLSDRDHRALMRLVNAGQHAKSDLIQANLRLVVSIAKRYSGRGMQFLDLIQEGNLGLMRAVDKFDHTKGFKFSTYATWWIRQAITRSIADQARTIRIPVHMVENMNRVLRTQRELQQRLKADPTMEQLADECAMSVERVREILRISQDPLSLDSPVGEEDDSNLGDFIKDPGAVAPDEQASKNDLMRVVEEALGELTEREQEIVRRRFGLDDGLPRTLEDVGREFGVTRERVRQIEAKTLAKLRHPHRSQRLKEFLDEE